MLYYTRIEHNVHPTYQVLIYIFYKFYNFFYIQITIEINFKKCSQILYQIKNKKCNTIRIFKGSTYF